MPKSASRTGRAVRCHLRVLPTLLALLALAAGAGAADGPTSVYPDPPGAQPRQLTRLGIELVPRNNGFHLQAVGVGTSVSCPAGQPFGFVETWMAPPHGARLLGFDLFGRDTSAQDQSMFAFRVCQQPASSPSPSSETTLLGSATSMGLPSGNFAARIDLSAGNEIVDGNSCRYLLRVSLSSQNQPCLGNDMLVHKVAVRYVYPQ